MANEQKSASIDETVDKFLSTDGAVEESSPQKTTPEPTEVRESDSPKTPEAEVDPGEDNLDNNDTGEVPKGFASHPKWQKLLQERNEAREKLTQADPRLALLDDPQALDRYLRSKGFSLSQAKSESEKSLFERIAAKKGWNVNALNPEQRAHIQDLIDLSDMVVEDRLGSSMKPLQQDLEYQRALRETDSQMDEVESMAATDGLDYQKEVLPAIKLFLEKLDKSGYKGPIDPVSAYERATRPIFVERNKASKSQDVRNVKKDSAKPLTSRVVSTSPGNKSRRDPEAELDAALEKHGFK